MNILKIEECEFNNGLGIGLTIFVSGCCHKCKGCFNRLSWSKNVGEPYDEGIFFKISDIIRRNKNITRVTFSGGDPLMRYNSKDVFNLIRSLKEEFNFLNFWVYTGYTMKDLYRIYKFTDLWLFDYIVDGRYEKDLPPASFRGSCNQTIWVKNKELKTFEKFLEE